MSLKISLENKTCLVTGALGLLGKEFCTSLWEAGATVIATDLDQTACDDFARNFPSRMIGKSLNLLDAKEVQELGDFVSKNFKAIDVLVNNAALNDKVEGGKGIPPFEEYPLELWENQWRVNATGVFQTCQVFGSQMARLKKGSIINIASTYGVCAPDQRLYQEKSGHQNFFKSIAYGATKAAVLSMTQYLSCYWGHLGVRVNAISPGGIENQQNPEFKEKYSQKTPLRRMGQVGEISGALIYLASSESSYMTGQNLVIDGGWTQW